MASPVYNSVAQDERAGHALEGAIASIVSDVVELLTGCYPGVVATLTVPISAGEVDGQEVDAGSLTFTASTATEFARDLVVVNPADGVLSIIAGVETTDQTAGSAAIPAPTGDLVALFACLVDSTDAEAETNQSTRGVGLDTTQTLDVVIADGLVDGVDIVTATVTVTASTASNFAKDLVSVDPTDGSLTVTAGTESASAVLAVIPDVPAGEVALVAITVGNAATGITVIDQSVRGQTPPTVG